MSRHFTLCLIALCLLTQTIQAQPLENTKPLTLEGDIASQIVTGADKFLLRQLDNTITARGKYWNRDSS